MSIEYVSPSALEHYDEKIKDFIDDKIKNSNVEVDDALSSTSTNPVQNKVVNTALSGKVSTTTKINNKALSSDITLSASDVGADASGSASTALSSAKTYTDSKIDALVGDGASTTLDTISEISKAIEEHQDVTDALNAAIGNKVDKVSGKGLSTNDLTGALKSNYDTAYTHSQAAHAPSTAEKNVIVGIQKNGSDLTVDSSTRKVNVTVPTKTSDLTNDSGFKTTDTVTTVTTTGSGNAITALSATNGAITATKGSTFLTAHPTISKSTDTTSSATATHGGTITMVDSVTRDGNGHVTKVNTKTVTLPSDNNTVYTHPTYTAKSNGLYKVTVDSTGHVSGTAAVTKSDITALGIPAQDTVTTLSSLGITATEAELNHTDGVTSNIQTQLDNKLSLSGGGVTGTISVKSSQAAPVTTISTNCNLSGGMLKTSPGGNTEITYGVTITDPSTDGSRATINGYKIYHEGNLAIPHNTELVFGEKGTTNRGFIKTTSNSLVIKAPGSNKTSNPMESSNANNADFGGAGLKFSYCSAGILPYSTLNGPGSMNIGSSTLKFGTIYSAASALNSDAKLKKNIESLSEEADKYLKAFDELNFVRFKWAQNMNSGLATPASSRYHLGLIAQELEKTLANNGIYGGDTGAIQANFFADNTSEAWISGGYQIKKEGYDYSENVWNYKHGLEYEWINEVIEKDFYEFNNAGGYNVRHNIKYIMFEDISKVASEGNQPPLKVNSITLVDKNDEYIDLELTENGISYYDHDNDTELKVPLSDAHLNEDGSLTINYNKMWATYMIEVPTFAFADYKTIIIDVDYIGEYKCYMIPEGDYKNANVWDRGNNDTILYDYSVNYNEIYALSLYALQETRKEFMEYKAATSALIADLTDKVNRLSQKVGE